MTESIIDTDILSFYFKGDSKVADYVTQYLREFEYVNLSIITYYEIIGGLTYKKAQRQLIDFEDFIKHNNLIYI